MPLWLVHHINNFVQNRCECFCNCPYFNLMNILLQNNCFLLPITQKNGLLEFYYFFKHDYYHNPTFGRMWRWHLHSRNGDLGVLRDSQNFKVRLQGKKHLALRRSSWNMERYWSVDGENGLAWAIWTSATQLMVKRRAESQTGSLTPDH